MEFNQLIINLNEIVHTNLISTSILFHLCPSGAYCPSEQYMVADSYIFNTTASYNNPTPISSPLTATVPFVKAQADHLYQLALSFQNLDYILAGFRINIFINYTNPMYSSFKANIYSLNTSNVNYLGFRYLLINSNFRKMYVSYHTTAIINTAMPVVPSVIPTTAYLQSVGGTISCFYVLIGIDIQSTSQRISFFVRLTGTTATSATFGFYTIYSGSTLKSASLLFIRYNESISDSPLQAQVTSQQSLRYISASSDTSLAYITINTFFGTWGVATLSDNFFNFDYSVTDGILSYSTTNSLIFQNGIAAIVIQIYLKDCCPSPTLFYYAINRTCYDICPPRLYPNSTAQLCMICPHDCFYCESNGNGRCISCSLDDYRTFYATTGRCNPNFGYYNDLGLSQAQPCAYDCYSCASLTVCYICIHGKTPVIGGCSNIIGCSHVSTNSSTNITSCLVCQDQFIKTWNNLCACPEGTWIITNHCSNVIGCLSTTRKNGTSRCTFCQPNFILYSDNCTCSSGFRLSNLNKCTQICGDGIIYNDTCDDGNLIDGDGCSSTCQKQLNYKCLNGSLIHPSRCFYNKGYQIYVHSINKTQFINQGVFSFKIRPTISSVISQHFVESLLFVCAQNITVEDWVFRNNLLTIKVNYTEDLEGNEAKLWLRLNSSYPIQSFLNITFTMKSRGLKLLVYKHYEQIVTISKILFGILSIPLILLLLGSLRHKMVGVQVLTTFQIIIITSTFSTNYTQPYSLLNYLSSSTCNLLFFSNYQSNFYSKQPYLWSLFTFNESNLFFSQYIIGGVIVFFLFVLIIRLFIRAICEKQDKKNRFQKADYVTRAIYSHGLFPFAIGFLFVNVFAYSSSAYYNFHYSADRIPIIIMELFLIITTSFIFFYEWASVLTASFKEENIGKTNCLTKTILNFEGCRKDYIPVYLIYLFTIFSLFWLANITTFPYPLVSIISVTLIIFIWFLRNWVYQDTIHNVGQMLNLILILSFSAWVMLRQLLPMFTTEEKQILAIFMIVGLMIASLITNTIRIIFEYRKLLQCNKQKGQSTKLTSSSIANNHLRSDNKNGFDQKLQKMNPYSLQAQLMRKQNTKWEELNKQRLLNDTQPLYHDQFKQSFLNANTQIKNKSTAPIASNKSTYQHDINIKKNQILRDKTYLEQRKNRQIIE